MLVTAFYAFPKANTKWALVFSYPLLADVMEGAAEGIPKHGDLSSKAIAVAAGEAHTLVLTGDGCIYSWGRGILGRLGRNSEEDELSPVQVKFEDSVKIVGIAAGAYHSLALADDGTVWCWGYNIYGQLGVNGEDIDGEKHINGAYTTVPCLMNKFLGLRSLDSSTDTLETEGKPSPKIRTVKAGGMMSLAIDNLGALWIWGNFPQQKEGGFSLASSFTPTPILDFHGRTVVKVACGNEHVVALVSSGESYESKNLLCYSWGNNCNGQLGLGDSESRPRPEVVKTFDQDSPWAIYEIACGAFHTALLTYKKRPGDTSESTCWTFGLGDNGQLGHGTNQSTLLPTPVKDLPQYVNLISIDCGLFHTSVVSSAGDVWSWGMEKGLGLCPDAGLSGTYSGDALSPLLISCKPYEPKFPNPVQVACGAAHTVIVVQEGYKLWCWGRGRSGVLGNGTQVDSYTPTMVLWPPLAEDSKREELNNFSEEEKKEKNSGVTETDEKLSSALNELKLLQTKLSVMERYASILHGSIFGKPFDEQNIPLSLRNSGTFDIAREWENMLEASDHNNLVRLEMFYRHMLAGVKDKLMKRRINEIVKECLESSKAGN